MRDELPNSSDLSLATSCATSFPAKSSTVGQQSHTLLGPSPCGTSNDTKVCWHSESDGCGSNATYASMSEEHHLHEDDERQTSNVQLSLNTNKNEPRDSECSLRAGRFAHVHETESLVAIPSFLNKGKGSSTSKHVAHQDAIVPNTSYTSKSPCTASEPTVVFPQIVDTVTVSVPDASRTSTLTKLSLLQDHGVNSRSASRDRGENKNGEGSQVTGCTLQLRTPSMYSCAQCSVVLPTHGQLKSVFTSL